MIFALVFSRIWTHFILTSDFFQTLIALNLIGFLPIHLSIIRLHSLYPFFPSIEVIFFSDTYPLLFFALFAIACLRFLAILLYVFYLSIF